MKNILYALVLIILLSNTFIYSVYSAELNPLDSQKINLFCQDTPLKDVLDSVYKQTEFTIHIEDTLLAMPVTGKFNEVEISTFFQRIFRGKNIALLFSEKDKMFTVRTFGQKERNYYTVGKTDQIDPLTSMKLSELAALHDEQRKAFQEYSQNPLSVDLLTGMKLRDIHESQVRQREVFQEDSQNPDSLDPMVGKTLVELKESHDKQRQVFEAYSKNPESVDSLTGQKIVEIKMSHDLQRDEFQRYSSNPESIEPLTGLTFGQIRASQEKQRREFLGR